MEIKVLGTGCPNCVKLENNVKEALKLSGVDANVIKVQDIAKIMEYGVMSMPGIVINEEVVSFGKINSVDEIVELLNK